MDNNTTDTAEPSNTTNIEIVDTTVSSEQIGNTTEIAMTGSKDGQPNSNEPMFPFEKIIFSALKGAKKCCRITSVTDYKHKYEVEFFDVPLDKNEKKQFKELKENTVLATQMKLSQQLIEVQIKGLEYPITIKFKMRNGGYSRSVCELYRALHLRKGLKKGIDESSINKNVEQKLRDKLANSLNNENKLTNIKDSMQKLLGSANLRDLLFECIPTDKNFPLKYRKFIHISTLKKLNIDNFAIKDSFQHKLRYFYFDFDKKVWIEGKAKKVIKKKKKEK